MATLEELVQDIVDEIGIPRPSTVIGSTDDQVRRILVMMHREARDLVRQFEWTALQTLHTFTTVASQDEYSLPADYHRLVRDTEWDRAESRPLIGPITLQHWESIISSQLGSGVAFRRFRIGKSASSTDRVLYMEPTPSTTGDTMAYWYISKYFRESSADMRGDTFTDNNDTFLLDDDLLILGTIVRFKRSMGFEYASEADEHARLLGTIRAQDRPSPTLNLSSEASLRLISTHNAPETGYGP